MDPVTAFVVEFIRSRHVAHRIASDAAFNLTTRADAVARMKVESDTFRTRARILAATIPPEALQTLTTGIADAVNRAERSGEVTV